VTFINTERRPDGSTRWQSCGGDRFRPGRRPGHRPVSCTGGGQGGDHNRKPLSAEKDQIRPGETDKEYQEYLSLRGDAEKTAEEIRKNGGEASLFFGDVGDCGSARALIQYAVDTYGRIDILVNNAAGLGQGTIEETDAVSWEKQTRAKLSGAFYTAHYTVPYMQQGFGRILNCASDAWVGFSDFDAYSAANAGVVGLTCASAKERKPYHITVNAYCPQADSPGHVREFNQTVRQMVGTLGKAADPDAPEKAKHRHGDANNLGRSLPGCARRRRNTSRGASFR
jgi:3-oxoacyl-[acyl-carrier protein] reductase